jgi:hypothetical protein
VEQARHDLPGALPSGDEELGPRGCSPLWFTGVSHVNNVALSESYASFRAMRDGVRLPGVWVYDAAVQRGGWSRSTVVLQLRYTARLGGPPREALYTVALRDVR